MLSDVASLLRCVSCGARDFSVKPRAITCNGCGQTLPVNQDVLHVTSGLEDPAIARERQAMLALEAEAAAPGPYGHSLRRLLSADETALRAAFLSLPYDDGSPYYRHNEYFRSVSQFAPAFSTVLARLGLPAGSRVLDVGADLLWSSAQLARQGWHVVATDINHHLPVGRLFRDHGLHVATVNVDMHVPVFADAVFDGVTAFNALHHAQHLDVVVANLARVLRPGGRLGLIEPYWHDEGIRDRFGLQQIAAGINEHVHRLEEWHRAFVSHGLEVVCFNAGASFYAVYEKRPASETPRTLSLEQARDDLFQTYYRAEFGVPDVVSASHAEGPVVEVPVVLRNRSLAGWSCNSQWQVHLSYHVYRHEAVAEDAGAARVLQSFDNRRTPLPGDVDAGSDTIVALQVTVPDAPGRYVVEVDMVHEGTTWFAERGARPSSFVLHVS